MDLSQFKDFLNLRGMLKREKDKIRILYLSQYYPPEINPPSVRVSELSSRWIKMGHDMTILTGMPNHPHGIIHDAYKGKRLLRENVNGVKIIRVWFYVAANKGFIKRVLSFLSFMFSAIFLGMTRLQNCDIVIATSPQFFTAVAGLLISKFLGVPFVFEVRDIWPAEIVAVGALRNQTLIKILEAIELFLYKKANMIVALAEGTIKILQKRGIPKEKIIFIPNGVDSHLFETPLSTDKTRDHLQLDGKFIISYIGTHGMAQKLETVLFSAKNLSARNDIVFIFLGEGSEKKRLIQLAQELKLENVIFLPQQERTKIPTFIQASNICLVPLRNAELFKHNIPSKIFEIMACSRPIIVGVDGESRELVVNRAKAGIFYKPEDSVALSSAIMKLYNDRKLSSRLGRNGQCFVNIHFDRDVLAHKYIDKLKEVVKSN